MNQTNERHKRICEALIDHYNEASMIIPDKRIFALCLQGSQNYGLDTSESDIDTKCLIFPSFKEIVMNKKPISTTHIRENEEHIDLKDIRSYWNLFKKSNPNFVEILFTPYYFVNEDYFYNWQVILTHREEIAHINPYAAVKAMKGMAMEKYHALEHPYPSKINVITKYGYDGKQLSHMLRIEEMLTKYIKGYSYCECLNPKDKEYLIKVKRNQMYSLENAREVAEKTLVYIIKIANDFCDKTDNKNNPEVEQFLDNALYQIMEKSMRKELMNCD